MATGTQTIEIKLQDSIKTNFSGYSKLLGFYHQANAYNNLTIHLDLNELNWLDANLVALLSAMLYKLAQENQLQFTTDFEFIENKFDVLCRNGFIPSQNVQEDGRDTSIKVLSFLPDEKDGFIDYIEKLMRHEKMPQLDKNHADQIKQDLIEILCNINYHAKTDNPFFVCGQYYGSQGFLKLTIVDLGVGFLPAIQEATSGTITNSKDAIAWALQGNSSKPRHHQIPGGLGIKNIYKYCRESGGIFQIITGDTYWSSALEKSGVLGYRNIIHPFCGTTTNLFFNCK